MSRPRRVLLLNPPGSKMYARDKYCSSVSKADYYWPAVDFVFQSGYLSPRHEVFIIDAIAEGLGPRDALRRMARIKPEAVLFLTASASWPEDLAFIRKAKGEMAFEAIALGGWLLALATKALDRFDYIDAVLLDFACDDLARYISGERPLHNMAWREDGEIIEGERKGADPFEIPPPRHDLLPLDKYRFPLAKHKKFTVTNATVGCPWKCRFCVPGTVTFRARTVGNVIEELKYVKRLGIEEVLFHDATFTAGRKRVTGLVETMLGAGLGLSWMCQARADTVDRELLRLMKRAGCHSIEFGVESGSDAVLASMHKGESREAIEKAFAMAREEGIRTNAFFIIGMPGETEEDIEQTIEFARKLNPAVASFSVPMPHPGTALGDGENMDDRFIDNGIYVDDVSPPKLSSGKLSPEKVWELRNRAMKRFYLNPRYILGKFMALRSIHDFTRDARLAVSLFKSLFKAGGGAAKTPEKKGETAECPLCGFGAGLYGEERGHKINECSRCGLFFVDNPPSEEDLKGYYEGVHERIRPETWSRHGEAVWSAILKGMKTRMPRGRVLDVGSGAGHFIEMLRGAGYEAFGVEPAADVSEDGPVIAHKLADAPPSAGQFDVITMLWTLEHLPDPDEAIAGASRLLKPDGLLIVRVPNMSFIRPVHQLKFMERLFPGLFKALINPASNKQAFFELLGPPYHLYGYSPSTLKRLLEGHGFIVERMGVDGGLKTGKAVRDLMDKPLLFMAKILEKVSGGRFVLYYDVTTWARKGGAP